jgi:hypothetical protein
MNTVMVTRFFSAPPARCRVLLEDRPRLRLEVARDVGAVLVGQRGLSGEIDRAAAFRDDRGREGARLLHLGLFKVLGGIGARQAEHGGGQRDDEALHRGSSGVLQ